MFCLKVLEEKEERIAPGTLLAPSHTYANLAEVLPFRYICAFQVLIFYSELCSDTGM